MTDYLFFSTVFLLALLYSSVGHGGASGYLALMAIFSFPPEFMRPTALVLNILVSSIALVAFSRNRHLNGKLLLPFVISSVPMAFLGGSISVDPKLYKIFLGLFLLAAIARMIFQPRSHSTENKSINKPLAWGIGALLGFFSGLIGIGGGIILSPVIILLKWGSMKQTAAVSAAFILVNSVSGLTGQWSAGITFAPQMGGMLIFAVLGGLLGSHLGSIKFPENMLKYSLVVVLGLASIKLLAF
ncbi:MAG: sulfite exporter TauE/SafE family protein [Bacteroidales bacterium]